MLNYRSRVNINTHTATRWFWLLNWRGYILYSYKWQGKCWQAALESPLSLPYHYTFKNYFLPLCYSSWSSPIISCATLLHHPMYIDTCFYCISHIDCFESSYRMTVKDYTANIHHIWQIVFIILQLSSFTYYCVLGNRTCTWMLLPILAFMSIGPCILTLLGLVHDVM